MLVLERSFEEQMDFQRMNESSRRFIRGSSRSRSLKQDTGAKKMIAVTFSK